MAGINTTRVVVGGLVAGLVLNIGETLLNAVVLADEMAAVTARFNLPPIGGGAIGVFVVMCFLLGILTTWLYAAIRPRFGAGPKTAARAGVTIWLAAFLFPGIGYLVMGFFPANVTWLALGWSLIEMLAASIAGGYFYHEHAAPAMARA